MSDTIGLNIREQATSKSQCLGLLLRDSLVEVGEHSPDKKWARISRIVEGSIESVRKDGSVPPEAAHGWVFLPQLDPESAPTAFDQVVTLGTPHPMKQGEVISYLGEDVLARAQPIADQPVTRKVLHLEIFSGDDVPAYLAASRRWAKQHLPDSQRTLLVLRPGDAVYGAPNGTMTCKLQGSYALPLAGLEAKELEGKRWRKVSKLRAENGAEAAGWVPEEGRLASPWEWPGFEVLDEAASGFGAMWKSVEEMAGWYRREAPRPEETPFYKALRKLLDTNHDGNVSEAELDAALCDRARAGQIGRIIARHDSEWADASMQSLMRAMQALAEKLGPNTVENVKAERPRADKLPWWDEVASGVKGFPQSMRVYHFHPGGVAGNFVGAGVIRIEEARVRAFLRMIRIGEGTQGQRGYETLFGGSSFIKDHGKDFSDHPRIKIRRGGYVSSAAGAYQVMGYTWDDPSQVALRKNYGILNFSPASQDRYGVILLRFKRSALEEIKAGQIRSAIEKCNREWASLPGSPYGQPTVDWDRVLREFDEYLRDEMTGRSDLAIAPGGMNDLVY